MCARVRIHARPVERYVSSDRTTTVAREPEQASPNASPFFFLFSSPPSFSFPFFSLFLLFSRSLTSTQRGKKQQGVRWKTVASGILVFIQRTVPLSPSFCPFVHSIALPDPFPGPSPRKARPRTLRTNSSSGLSNLSRESIKATLYRATRFNWLHRTDGWTFRYLPRSTGRYKFASTIHWTIHSSHTEREFPHENSTLISSMAITGHPCRDYELTRVGSNLYAKPSFPPDAFRAESMVERRQRMFVAIILPPRGVFSPLREKTTRFYLLMYDRKKSSDIQFNL